MSGSAAVTPERSLSWRRICVDVSTAKESFAPKKKKDLASVLLLCCVLLLSKFGIYSSSGTGKINQTAIKGFARA